MPEDRPPFVVQRAHGVAPNADGKKADEAFRAAAPERQLRRQARSAPTPVQQAPKSSESLTSAKVPPHQLVLADLKEQKKLIDAAIAAIEALYQ